MMMDGDPAVEMTSHDGDSDTPSGLELVTITPDPERREHLRIVEALLFAACEPLDEKTLGESLPEGTDCASLLQELQGIYEGRGVDLVTVGGRWQFRTAEDLAWLLEKHSVTQRRLSRAALETLAIVAFHQPVTRAEIEEIRGVATSKGTLDVLLETDWVRLRGRRRAPGRPITYGTTQAFLEHFGFESLSDLPGFGELKSMGLLSSDVPADFVMPVPRDLPDLAEDEDPFEDDEDDEPDLFDDDDEDDADDAAGNGVS